jgi:hypothetical protein
MDGGTERLSNTCTNWCSSTTITHHISLIPILFEFLKAYTYLMLSQARCTLLMPSLVQGAADVKD